MSVRRWLQNGAEAIVLALLILYVGSYLVLSRRAFAVADATNAEGFCFVDPSSDAACRMHELCSLVYYPLLRLDQWLGTGRPAAFCPLRGLSMITGHTRLATSTRPSIPSRSRMHNRQNRTDGNWSLDTLALATP
ncbi:MAG: hypothetical protein K2Y37_21825 [Pirellulales bacterium]|nr:hypothetical protein [Pirellulales bacterium]